MRTPSIHSRQLHHKLIVVFFLMSVLPTAYLLVCIKTFTPLGYGLAAHPLGLKQSLTIGLPAIALMSTAALTLLIGSTRQLKQVLSDMRVLLQELGSCEDSGADTFDEIDRVSCCLSAVKRAFQSRLSALNHDRDNLEARNERLSRVALADPETELYNRKYAMRVLNVEIPRAIRHETPLCVLIVAADDFDAVNTKYGREVGNRVLKELAALIDTSTRRIDMVARYGGEEFLAILPETNFNDAVRVAERVRVAVSEQAFAVGEDESVMLTVSVGVATLDGIMDAEKLLLRAAHSLLTARRVGENMVLA